MAAPGETTTTKTSQPSSHDGFPNPQPAKKSAAEPEADTESILSSRMTDIASDDGGEGDRQPTHTSQRRSIQTTTSRPTTGVTGASTQRGAWPPGSASRRHPPLSGHQRGSAFGSVSSISNRPQSSTSRTHVPSLTSHAFFRPMSSQKLQAQRGGSRPAAVAQPGTNDDGLPGPGNGLARYSVNSNATLRTGAAPEDGSGPAPPSRGTEMTEQDTAGRRTVNTSPTPGQGHTATGSVSESVRPLQRNHVNMKGLSLNFDKSYRNVNNLATPAKSPRSFRSSFLLPSRGDIDSHSPNRSLNRSTEGAQKLASVASSPGLTPVDALKEEPKKAKVGSNWEYFTGNTVFCWGGRIQNTRHKPINIATGLFVLIPGGLFLGFSAPWIWHHISPAIPIIFAYLLYICLSSFFHASLSDPGILPRNLHPMPPAGDDEDPLRLAPSMNDWTMIKSAQSSTAAMEVPTKYCKTCNIWRPARGHHCRICDNCIETQDHHCVWLNNCVGRRNYRYFFTFVSTATLLAVFLIGADLAQILVYRNRQRISFGAAIRHFPVPFAMVIYGIIAFPYPMALMSYHLFLMGRGETTREYLNSHKFLKKDRHRPFTQGDIIKNWLVVLCRPRPPTYLNFKRKYEDGDQRFGERRGKRTAPLTSEAQGGRGAVMEMQDVPADQRGFQSPSQLGVESPSNV